MSPQPYYQDDAVTIYHGDCLEVLAWAEADVLLTDPPYGIDWQQPAYRAVGASEGTRTRQHLGIQNDDTTLARDEMLAHWGKSKPGLVFGSAEVPPPAGTRRTLVWQKPADSGLFGSTIWRKDWEPVFMVGKWPQVPATESSIVRSACGSHREYAQGVHPHAKPTDLLKKLLVVMPAGMVADPFCGSGSTLRAAKDLGRRAIGVELDEAYCEIAARRCAQEVLAL